MHAVVQRDEAVEAVESLSNEVHVLRQQAAAVVDDARVSRDSQRALSLAESRLRVLASKAKAAEERAVHAEAFAKGEQARTEMEVRRLHRRLKDLEAELSEGRASLKDCQVVTQQLRAAVKDNEFASRALNNMLSGAAYEQPRAPARAVPRASGVGSWVVSDAGSVHSVSPNRRIEFK